MQLLLYPPEKIRCARCGEPADLVGIAKTLEGEDPEDLVKFGERGQALVRDANQTPVAVMIGACHPCLAKLVSRTKAPWSIFVDPSYWSDDAH